MYNQWKGNSMNICEICGKECKTGQGLGAHKRWVHGQPSRKQLRLFPTRRLITDMELIELFKQRDEVNHQIHMDLLDNFDKRTKTLLAQIQRQDKELLDLKEEFAKVYKQFNDVLEQLNKVKV
jgi:hypothetical protein